MDVPLASASGQMAQSAQSEVQPFFSARIFSSNIATSNDPQDGRATAALAALRLSLASAFDTWLRNPYPSGLNGYVFYRSSLQMSVMHGSISKDGSTVVPPHLRLSMQTGGATEDEFALVHFLRLQQRRGQLLEDFYVQVHDEDGEFLLIEAADHLPDWVDPDNADGRVWLASGQLKLISAGEGFSMPEGSSKRSKISPIKDLRIALRTIVRLSSSLQTSQTLDDAAFSRLSTYPETQWTEAVQHRTTAYLVSPLLAQSLVRRPQLVARAGRAFLGRDSRDMRGAGKMQRFTASSTQDQGAHTSSLTASPCLVPLRMPRRLYAQLNSVRFLPPKSFPLPYRERIEQYYEHLDAQEARSVGSGIVSDQVKLNVLKEGRRWDLGCKLSIGLEMAYWNDKERAASQARTRGKFFNDTPQSLHDDFRPRADPGYPDFIDKLNALGYFQNEVRDSRKWKDLEEIAIKDWRKTRPSHSEDNAGDNDDDVDCELDWVAMVNELVHQPNDEAVVSLDPCNAGAVASSEQSDSWLYEAGDSFLNGGDDASRTTTGDEESAEKEATQRLSDFASRVEKFIEGKGDVEGALIDETDDSGSGSSEDQSDDEDDRMDLDRRSEQDDDDGGNDEAVALETRKRLDGMTTEQRCERLQALLPALGKPVDWQVDHDIAARKSLENGLRELDRVPSPPSVRLEEPVVPSDTSVPTTKLKKHVQPSVLSSEELRDSLQAQAKVYHSSTISSHFDGAESWQLEDSDNDSEAGLDADGKPETKEQRRERARLLDLEISDDEIEEQAGMEDGEGELAGEEYRAENDEREEMEEFVDFARKELGLSEEQVAKIMQQRQDSGRWVPGRELLAATTPSRPSVAQDKGRTAPSTIDSTPATSFGTGFKQGFLNRQNSETPKAKTVSFVDDLAADKTQAEASTVGPHLASFESLMGAMDSALDAHRRAKGLPPLDREEAYGGAIRAEDWALRRPGGASLGSVIQQQQQQQEKDLNSAKPQGQGRSDFYDTTSSKSKDREVPNAAAAAAAAAALPEQVTPATGVQRQSMSACISDEDEDEEEDQPLSARDTALLNRLLKEQNQAPPSFEELVGMPRRQTSDPVASAKICEIDESENQRRGRKDDGEENKDEDEEVYAEDKDEEMLPDLAIDGDGDDDDETVEGEAEGQDVAISNLLESWRAQGGAAGPMGTLAGGMGFGSRAPR